MVRVYGTSVPEPRADGALLYERHGLLFVDYLRLVFRFGGFSGYDGICWRACGDRDSARWIAGVLSRDQD